MNLRNNYVTYYVIKFLKNEIYLAVRGFHNIILLCFVTATQININWILGLILINIWSVLKISDFSHSQKWIFFSFKTFYDLYTVRCSDIQSRNQSNFHAGVVNVRNKGVNHNPDHFRNAWVRSDVIYACKIIWICAGGDSSGTFVFIFVLGNLNLTIRTVVLRDRWLKELHNEFQ